MNRISRQVAFMEMAEVAARRSTCFRGNVGAIIAQGNDVLSMGYNGPPSGQPHCAGNDCALSATGGCARSDHAEANAIKRALVKLASSGIGAKLGKCDLYCTYSPCLDCARLIFNQYTNRFFYRYSYRDPEGLKFLLANAPRMGIYRVTPSGYIISERSKNIMSPEDIR